MKTNVKREERIVGESDSKITVTVLSHVAVTSLTVCNQWFKCECVTGDSKFLLFNSLVEGLRDYIPAHFT